MAVGKYLLCSIFCIHAVPFFKGKGCPLIFPATYSLEESLIPPLKKEGKGGFIKITIAFLLTAIDETKINRSKNGIL